MRLTLPEDSCLEGPPPVLSGGSPVLGVEVGVLLTLHQKSLESKMRFA
jgi:hypothetical protein